MYKLVVKRWTGREWEIVRVLSEHDTLAEAEVEAERRRGEVGRKDRHLYAVNHKCDVVAG
jgi:hypothetical protein